MRELTLREKAILWFAPMFMKYRVFRKLFDEDHTRGIGKGSSPNPLFFGLSTIDSVSLRWDDHDAEDIYINRFPLTELILVICFISFWGSFLWDALRVWRGIVEQFAV